MIYRKELHNKLIVKITQRIIDIVSYNVIKNEQIGMRIKKIQLKKFKRFTDLTINFGNEPKKIIALVGPNGCGKSSIFDAFEDKSTDYRGGSRDSLYLNKIFSNEKDPDKYDSSKQIIIETDSEKFNKISFYIRSSYRFTPRIEVSQIKKLPNIEDDSNRPKTSIEIDNRMQENYERLIGTFYEQVYDKEITGKQWATQNMQALNDVLRSVLQVSISYLGNPVENKGKLYFDKGDSKNFPYELLSSGEKGAIDIILDIIIKTKSYSDTIFCIDEPELHLNTAIQRKLLIEIEKLIPENCQLWIATHSIGFLRALQDELKEKTQVINLGDNNFDNLITLNPIKQTRSEWKNIFQTALEDITGLIAPKKIIYCEGTICNSLDEKILNEIFAEINDCLFVSSTNKNDSPKYAEIALTILNKAFNDVEIIVLSDRDNENENISRRKSSVTIKKLRRREFENYLYDYEIVKMTFPNITEAMHNSVINDIINDDVKNKVNELIQLTQEKITEKEFKSRLSTNLKNTTLVYDELYKSIFE